jgi:hypothetical protein
MPATAYFLQGWRGGNKLHEMTRQCANNALPPGIGVNHGIAGIRLTLACSGNTIGKISMVSKQALRRVDISRVG